jgi:hypothetical protein
VKDLVRQRTYVSLELVHGNDDVIGGDAATAREGGMVFDSGHFRALEHLHAVVDEHVLESLQAKQRIDPIGAGVADSGGISLGSENALEPVAIVDGLVGEAHAPSAFRLGLDLLLAVLAETEEQRILLQQPTFDVELPDAADDAFDAAARRIPDVLGRFRSVTPHQLIQLELTVGRKESGAASRAASAEDIFLEQDDFESFLDELRRRTDAAEPAAHDENVAPDVLLKRRAVLELLGQQRGEPPILVDH